MDENALNYDEYATNSSGDCDYNPEVGVSFGNIDAENGTIDLFVSQNKDIDYVSITITGATITGTSGDFGDAVTVEIVNNPDYTINITGLMPGPWSGVGLQLTYADGGSEFCLTDGSATAPGYESVNVTLGGCSVFVGADGGEIVSEDGGVNIPEGALEESGMFTPPSSLTISPPSAPTNTEQPPKVTLTDSYPGAVAEPSVKQNSLPPSAYVS
jgi:hypothetical protein